ncbi:MAG: DUF881 domain-containing protein [Clostridiaceae bacterium]|jgi:uncharacterized protein YlxW (UPF0749 family)|nr:DUF881 domain-containing protein [Clostridiaceae bacterium]
MKFFKVTSLTLVCMLLGVVIAMQYRSVMVINSLSVYEQQRSSDLITDLLREKRNNEQLQQRINELQKDLETYRTSSSNELETIRELNEYINKLQILAGLKTVKGAGVVVTMDSIGNAYLDDDHILTVLNELRATDVQALAVNDERIIATSEVRKAGSYMTVNGRKLLPPYVIKAIADPDKLESSLKMMTGVVETLEYLNIKVDVKKEENIIIPAVRDDGTVLRYDLLTPVD